MKIREGGIRKLSSVKFNMMAHGMEVSPGMYPWMVALYYNEELFVCAGTLVSLKFVLTAAHCFLIFKRARPIDSEQRICVIDNYLNTGESQKILCFLDDRLYYYKIGIQGRNNSTVSEFVPIRRVIRHPEYNIATHANNIALVELSSSLKCELFLSPICLPKSVRVPEPEVGTEVIIAGWKTTDGTSGSRSSSPTLMESRVRIKTEGDCSATRNGLDSHICGQQEPNEPCVSDSGGSIFSPPLGILHYIFGVISFDNGGCNSSTQYYTNITRHLDWILQTMEPSTESTESSVSQSITSQTTSDPQLDEPCLCGSSGDPFVSVNGSVNENSTPKETQNSTPEKSSKIVGGWIVNPPEKYPWTVLIRTQQEGGGYIFGAGSLISQTFILTVAHIFETNGIVRPLDHQQKFCITQHDRNVTCFVEDPSKITIYSQGRNTTPSESFSIRRYILHPEYILFRKTNDIALVQMPRRLRCDRFLRPICLPKNVPQLNTGTEVIIVGWGRTSAGAEISESLMEARSVVTKGDECRFGRYESHFCAQQNSQSICEGDSGGPLFRAVGLSFYIFGINSFGLEERCIPTFPQYFTNVTLFLDWIQNTMESNGSEGLPIYPTDSPPHSSPTNNAFTSHPTQHDRLNG